VNERRSGCFSGYRVNCESVPCLPARLVADCLTDPRQIPYLLIWTRRSRSAGSALNELSQGLEPKEAVRLTRTSSPGESIWVEVERWNGTRISLRVTEHPLPRRGGRDLLLICNCCQKARRSLYGLAAISCQRYVKRADWLCRTCAGLSYASEGGALVFRTRWAVTRPLSGLRLTPRPGMWTPHVCTSPHQAVELGLLQNASLINGTAKLAV